MKNAFRGTQKVTAQATVRSKIQTETNKRQIKSSPDLDPLDGGGELVAWTNTHLCRQTRVVCPPSPIYNRRALLQRACTCGTCTLCPSPEIPHPPIQSICMFCNAPSQVPRPPCAAQAQNRWRFVGPKAADRPCHPQFLAMPAYRGCTRCVRGQSE